MNYLRNCHIHLRTGDRPLFVMDQAYAEIHVDGYAIVPIERYTNLWALLKDWWRLRRS